MTKVDIDLWWYPTIEKNGVCQNCLNWQTSDESADLLEERNRPSFDEWEVLSCLASTSIYYWMWHAMKVSSLFMFVLCFNHVMAKEEIYGQAPMNVYSFPLITV